MSTRTWIALLSLAFLTTITSAATITRTYSITGSGEGFSSASGALTFEISGSFTYVIPQIGLPYFSSFTVKSTSSIPQFSDAITFGLKDQANDPTINGSGPACIDSLVGAEATLRLMTTCLQAQNSSSKALWILAISNSSFSRGFGFPYVSGFTTVLGQDSIYIGGAIPGDYSALGTLIEIGSWTTTLVSESTDAPQIPEPATFLLVSASCGLVILAKRREP